MSDIAYSYMDWPGIEAVIYSEEASPKDVMAPRIVPEGVLIQGFFPQADRVQIVAGRKVYDMELEDEAGYYAAVIPGRRIPGYRFRVFQGEQRKEFADPYAFDAWITEEEEKAFCAGTYYEAFRKLGSHTITRDGVDGTSFAVWAPNAVRVSIVGDFNGWDGRTMPMHRMPMSGIFELFVPGLGEGEAYLYEIRTKGGRTLLKADPYARDTVIYPENRREIMLSVTTADREFAWTDGKWLKARNRFADRSQPISIAEINLKEWESPEAVLEYVMAGGFTHVELTPVMEYLDSSSDGYSTAAYFSVTRRIGADELRSLIDRFHSHGVGVILDWTPAQFPRISAGLERYDGTVLYEKQDSETAVHPVWGTLLYNYDSPMVVDFLLSGACFWTEEFHADGLRLDDVAAMLYLDYGRNQGEWTPNFYGTNENLAALEFIKHLNSILHMRNPGVLVIAQEDGLWAELTDSVENDHLGFDYKWNTDWTRSLKSYLAVDPILRKGSHDQLTLSMLYAYCEHYILPIGRREIGTLQTWKESFPVPDQLKAGQLRETLAYQAFHPGCMMTTVHPEDTGELAVFLKELNKLLVSHPALYQADDTFEGFEWIQLTRYEENVLAFLRKTEDEKETLLAVLNFAAVPYKNYQVGVPFHGKFKEIFNTDQTKYGGSGLVNPRVKTSRAEECDEREESIRIRLGALSAAIFTCTEI